MVCLRQGRAGSRQDTVEPAASLSSVSGHSAQSGPHVAPLCHLLSYGVLLPYTAHLLRAPAPGLQDRVFCPLLSLFRQPVPPSPTTWRTRALPSTDAWGSQHVAQIPPAKNEPQLSVLSSKF